MHTERQTTNLSVKQANRGFATEEVSFLSFFSMSGYVGFFWGGWMEKKGGTLRGLRIQRDAILLQAGSTWNDGM